MINVNNSSVCDTDAETRLRIVCYLLAMSIVLNCLMSVLIFALIML